MDNPRPIRADGSFRTLVFDYLKTVVPFWRICDEAWALGNDYLVGIGVERNYGGQVMVVPQPEDAGGPHPRWPNIVAELDAAGIMPDRIVVIVDDRNGFHKPGTPFVEIPWSERERLADFVIKDKP